MQKNLCMDFHIYGHGYQADIDLPQEMIWHQLDATLSRYFSDNKGSLGAFVLMENHFHLLVEIENTESLFSLRESLIDDLGLEQNYLNHQHVSNYRQYLETYKYIYRNPLEAGLVSKVESYEYSTLHVLLVGHPMKTMVNDRMKLLFNPFHTLEWLSGRREFSYRVGS